MTTFEFTFSDTFCIEANRRTRQCRAINKYATVLKILIAAILVGIAVFLTTLRLYAVAAMLVVLIALILSGRYVNEGPLRRHVRRHWQYNKRITIELLEDEVRSTTDKVKIQVLWTIFTKARRFDDGFLLFQGPTHQNWLPISAIVTGSEEDAHQLIESHVSDYTKV